VFDVALSESKVHRRRPGEERKDGKVLSTNRLWRGCCRLNDPNAMRYRLRKGWLDDSVSSMAKRAIRVDRLSVCMYVPDLHNRGTNDKCATEEAERGPE
jgi:hypothetical protein